MNYNLVSPSNSKKVVINNFFLTLILFSGSIMKIISDFIPIDNLLGFILLFGAIIVTFFGEVKIYYKVIIGYLLILFILLFEMLIVFNPQQVTYLISLLSFGLVGILSTLVNVDYKHIYKYGVIIGLFWLILNNINGFEYAKDDPFAFGLLMLPMIYFLFSFIRNTTQYKKVFIASLLLSLYLLYILFQYSGRGALVNLVIFISLKLITSRKKIYKLLSGVMIIIGITIFMRIEKVLIFLQEKAPIKLDAIDKTLYLFNNQHDITNGRLSIYANALNSLNGFEIIFGRGIGDYVYSMHGNYSHNVFISILLDWGLIGLITFLILVIKYLIVMFNITNKDKLDFMIIIFSLSIGYLMFSGDYLTSIPFFIFIGLALRSPINKKK
jgi:O-antigen ligase